jgi:lysyl-tRNA synthetase class 2
LDGRSEEDGRVDIYSLACVLYEALTGKQPFEGDTTPRLIAAHLTEPPPRPSIARPEVPARVDDVIATGMAKDPDRRYATTVELATAAHDAITVPIRQPAAIPTRLHDTQPAPTRGAAELVAVQATPRGATERGRAEDAQRAVALTPPRPASVFFWVPAAAGWTVGAVATLALITSVLGPVRKLIRVPREFIDAYLFNFPDTSILWSLVLALLAVALIARKRIAWLLLLGMMVLSAMLNVVDITEGGNTAAESLGSNVGLVFHVVAALLLLLSYREFGAKVRRGARFKTATVLITGWLIAMLLSWGLIEMFPGTLTPDHRFVYVLNRVVGCAVMDPSLFTGRPHILLNAVMGLLGALALMVAAVVWFRSQRTANTLTARDESTVRELLLTYGQNAPASYFAEARDNAVSFTDDRRAAIVYRVEVGVSLASGDPIGDPDAWPQAVDAWLRLCRVYGWTPAAMEVSAAGARAYRGAGFIALQPGGNTVVRPARSKLSGSTKCAVNCAVKRARRTGR